MGNITRVGILGTENSHAMAFTKCINLTDKNGVLNFPDFRVVALYALEKAPSEAITKECGKEIKIYENINDMIPEVDCVMVTARHGKYHLPFSIPFIQAGKPVFIDKPFTITEEDAETILFEAKKNNVPICGGSGCKYSKDLLKLKEDLDSNIYGAIKSAVINFPADITSEYGGIYFYASHLIEMSAAIFGYDIKTVNSFNKNGNITVIAEYENYNIVLNFAKNNKYYAIVYCEKDIFIKELSIDDIYFYETKHFCDMVRNNRSIMTEEQLIIPVYIMNAIEKSLETKKAEPIKQIKQL